MSRSNPSEPKPWLVPGYRFSIDWPPNYVPVLAEQMIRAKKRGVTPNEAGQNAFGVVGGTIPGLGRKSEPDLAKVLRMAKPSQM